MREYENKQYPLRQMSMDEVRREYLQGEIDIEAMQDLEQKAARTQDSVASPDFTHSAPSPLKKAG